jgi:cytochrome b pre-mRNA-processing protein 3
MAVAAIRLAAAGRNPVDRDEGRRLDIRIVSLYPRPDHVPGGAPFCNPGQGDECAARIQAIPMILPLFRRNRRNDSIDRLYGAIVAQARLPVFYARYGVPDSVEGRLDMIMLQTVLLWQRVNGEGEALAALGQAVFDRFCQDMDDNLREMGVGDLAVPKQMQRIAGAFYGRAKVYQAAVAASDTTVLVDALRRNIYQDGQGTESSARSLAAYVRDAAAHLRGIDNAVLASGDLSFPEPAAAVATSTEP